MSSSRPVSAAGTAISALPVPTAMIKSLAGSVTKSGNLTSHWHMRLCTTGVSVFIALTPRAGARICRKGFFAHDHFVGQDTEGLGLVVPPLPTQTSTPVVRHP